MSIRYLKYFTFLSAEQIAEAEAKTRRKSRRARGAQGAGEGRDGINPRKSATFAAEHASKILFGGTVESIPEITFS